MEREIFDDEHVIARSSRVPGQPVVFQPNAGVGFPVVLGHCRWGLKMGGETGTEDVWSKGVRSPWIGHRALALVFITIVAPVAALAVFLVRAGLVVGVIGSDRLLSGADGVTGIAVGAEALLDGYVDVPLLVVLVLCRGGHLTMLGLLASGPSRAS